MTGATLESWHSRAMHVVAESAGGKSGGGGGESEKDMCTKVQKRTVQATAAKQEGAASGSR